MKVKKKIVHSLDSGTIRDIVLDRLNELGMSRSELAHHHLIDSAPSTVFRFLNGGHQTFVATVEDILYVLDLGIAIVE